MAGEYLFGKPCVGRVRRATVSATIGAVAYGEVDFFAYDVEGDLLA